MNPKDLPVTYWLLIILVAVFILQVIGTAKGIPITESLILNPTAVLQGQQLWGVFTNMFLHGGVYHILFNAIALFTFGISLERIVGRKNLLKVFLLSGLFASVFYILTSVFILGSGASALGASGAIFGVIGAMTALRPHTKIIMMFAPVPIDLWIGSIIFVLIALFWFGTGGGTGIAENAHLGGLMIGLLFGFCFKRMEKADPDFTWNAVYAPKKDPYGWIDEYR